MVNAQNAPMPLARYSQGIKVGNTLYIQGMIGLDPVTGKLVEGGIVNETKRVFESIEAVLKEAGMGFENVVKVVAYLSDIADYAQFNKIYNSCFETGIAPVRTTVEAKLPISARVEVEVVACET